MPLPDRPVSGATIDSVWGQTIHDYTFAPAGCKVHGSTNGGVGTSQSKMTLATVDSDPGGYLDAANNQVEIPTGGDGLYSLVVRMNSINGSAGSGFQTRGLLYLNGSVISIDTVDNAGGTTVSITIPFQDELSAGDILAVYAQRIGAGTSPDVTVTSFSLVRLGAEFGAP